MRHLGLFAAAAVGLAGCQAHNDVLVFGTGTVIGADASAAPSQGGAPAVSIGYKRWEGVWMPLKSAPRTPPVAGQEDGEPEGDGQLFQSEVPHGTSTRKDAYSVFASLGARFNSGATGAEVKAGAGIAQFFATGAAAVSVTQNEALVTVLKVDSDKATEAQSRAVESAAKNKTRTSVLGDTTAAEDAEAKLREAQEYAARERRAGLALACATTTDGTSRWPALVDKMGLSPEATDNLKKTKPADLRNRFVQNPALAQRTLQAGKDAPFSCEGE